MSSHDRTLSPGTDRNNSSKTMTLPTWEECNRKDYLGRTQDGPPLTALERFILDNEPCRLADDVTYADEEFRAQLAAVVSEVTSAHAPKPPAHETGCDHSDSKCYAASAWRCECGTLLPMDDGATTQNAPAEKPALHLRMAHALSEIRDHSTDDWAKGLAQQLIGPSREAVEQRARELRATGVKLIPNSWRCKHGTVHIWQIATAACGCDRPSAKASACGCGNPDCNGSGVPVNGAE